MAYQARVVQGRADYLADDSAKTCDRMLCCMRPPQPSQTTRSCADDDLPRVMLAFRGICLNQVRGMARVARRAAATLDLDQPAPVTNSGATIVEEVSQSGRPYAETHDMNAALHYTKAAPDGTIGPMIWGHVDFEADREELVPVTIHNIRGKEHHFTLDRNGFQIVRHQTSLTRPDFDVRSLVKEKYYAEIEDILKRHTGASLVKITHHVLRRSKVENPDNLRKTRPITQVHVDSNDDRIRYTVKAIWNQDYGKLLSKRYAMINVWRPLGKCYRDPLGFCDGSTVSEASFVPREIVMPGTSQRQVNTGVMKGEGHAWYYIHEQEMDEVILLKCWDSEDGVIKRCPHSSVPSSTSPPHLEDRESIELRCLLFWQD